MANFFLAIILILVFGSLGSLGGHDLDFFFSGVLGYAIAAIIGAKRRIGALEREAASLRDLLSRQGAGSEAFMGTEPVRPEPGASEEAQPPLGVAGEEVRAPSFGEGEEAQAPSFMQATESQAAAGDPSAAGASLSAGPSQIPQAPSAVGIPPAPRVPPASSVPPSSGVPPAAGWAPPSTEAPEATGGQGRAAGPAAAAQQASGTPWRTSGPAPTTPGAHDFRPGQPMGHPPGFDFVMRLLTGGNLLVKVGLLVLFVGVAFLVKYATDRNMLPIELRLTGVALGGIALLAVGWRLRKGRDIYALSLQGGGIGILYLVVFAAYRLYELIPPGLAFAFLLVLCALSAALAVLQDSVSLAVLGAAGGFLAPILTSTGKGSHVALFSYYALLNAGILGIAWFKAWRILNLEGFLFTFGIGAFWGYQYYIPANFASTEPFLILFFLFYAAIAVLFALRQPPQLKGYLDATIVFGTPVIAFMQQTVLVRPYEYGSAISAVVLGLFYLSLTWALFKKKPQEMRLLCEAFLAIGVGFGTIAIPLAFDARGTATAWALEGAALVWVGVRQERLSARVAGLLLQVGASLSLFPYFVGARATQHPIPVLNGICLGGVLVALAGVFSSFYLERNRERLRFWEVALAPFVGYWGLLWWFGTGLREIDRFVGLDFMTGSVAFFLAASCLACSYLRKRLQWSLLRIPALGLLPALALWGLASPAGHPFGRGGFWGWPAAMACLYRILYDHDDGKDVKENVLEWFYAGTFWLLAFLVTWEAGWQADRLALGKGSWREFATGVSLSLFALLTVMYGARIRWPIGKRLGCHLWTGLAPIVLADWIWAVAVSFASPGDPWPLPFLPLVNPLDVSIGFAFLALFTWLFKVKSPELAAPAWFLETIPLVRLLAGLSIFGWLNSALLRSLHYWAGVPLYGDAMMRSVLVQASLSIFWSLTALCLMVYSTRKAMRKLWLSGAGLLGVVVLKLFLVDLSNSGTLERIVSFVGVGILILIVGYLSPVPPQGEKSETKTL